MPSLNMSAGTISELVNHTLPNGYVATMTDLTSTESLDTIPDISATTLSQDKRELSAWYRVQDPLDRRETPQPDFPPPNPSSPDERDISPDSSNHRTFGERRHASLSPASSLTSLESDAETESSLTSLDDDTVSLTSAGMCKPGGTSRTTQAPFSKASRKRKRPAVQSVRRSLRLWVKRKKLASC